MLSGKKFSRMLLIVLALAITLVAAGCSNSAPSGENSTPPVTSSESPAAGDGSLQRVLDAGKLVVACETAWPPFAYMDGDQKLVGYDVEVAAEVAKRLGVEIEYSSSNSWAVR